MDKNQVENQASLLDIRAREMLVQNKAYAVWTPPGTPAEHPVKIQREYFDVKEEARDRH
jgi:hypothetical protein